LKKCFIFLIIICLLFCGCSAKKEIAVNIKSAAFDLDVNYYNEKYLFKVKTQNYCENMVCTVLSPEDLKDMEYTLNESGTTVSYMGITYTPKVGTVSVSNALDILYRVLKTLPEKTAVNDNGNYVINDKINGYDYAFYFSPAGLPLYLTVDGINLKMEFRNLTLVN